MTVRRESVVLDLDDRVAPGLLRVAAAAEVADKALEHMGGQQANASRTTRQLEGDTDRLSQRVERSASSIDKYSGRLGLLVSGLTAVGPATVPIAAVAIPAVTALGDNVVALGLGVGVTELAFHGLGSALQKFNTASALPTATNIAAAQKAMDALPPSAQRLVLELHRLTPLFDKLRQDAAGGGFAAGVTDGLHALLQDTPIVRQSIRGISGELGAMARESGDALSSDEWKPFLRFVGQEAPDSLHVMGAATGDVAHGLAEILMAFGPLDHQVNAGILKLAQDFDRWATSLGKTKDFQSFVEYIELNGPRVVGLLGDVGQLFVDLVQAAAPLGGPTVQALDAIVQLLDAIASSPLATPLLLLAQINAVLKLTSRSLAAVGVDARIGLGGVSTQARTGSTALSGLRADALSAGTALRTMGSNVGKNASTGTPLLAGVDRGGLASLGKGVLVGGGVALLASGAADKLGLANAATLALAGSLAGPLGAAAGAAVGSIIDVSHANDNLTASTRAAQAAVKGWNLDEESQSLADLNAQLDTTLRKQSFSADDGGFNPLKGFEAYATRINDFFTHSISEGQVAARQSQIVLDNQKTALALVAQGLSGKNLTVFPSDDRLQQTLTRVQPAMNALGISADDLTKAYAAGGTQLDSLVRRLVRYTTWADSAAGRSSAVSQAFADMSDKSLTTEQRVQALTSALDAMIDPMLNLGAAHDAFHRGLNDLDKSLVKNNKTLVGNSDAAITNRDAVRSQVSNLKTWVEAQARAGVAPQKMTAALKQGRQAIIDEGHAAGLNKGQIKAMVDQMGLTPKQIRTTVQLLGAQQAKSEISDVQRALNGIDRVVNVHVNVTRNTNALLADVNTPAHHRAGGGRIVGPGGPTSDEVPIWASDGEFMMRAAAVNKYGLGFMDAVNAGRFAAGGSVTTHATSSPGGAYATDGSPGAAATAAAHGLHALQLASAAATKQLDAERQQRQNLMQERAQLASTVSDNFRSPLFGDATGGVWGAAAAADPRSILRGDIRGGRQYIHDISRLRREGLRGGALEDVQTLAQAQQALAYSPAQLRQISHLFDVRRRVSRRAGETAGDLRYGKQIDQVADEIRKERAEVVKLRHEVAHLRKEAPKNAKLAGDSTMHRVNRAVTNGVRRRRNP